MSIQGTDHQLDTVTSIRKPPKYQVVLLNDDFTPMDFVVEVIMSYFPYSLEEATRIMLQVHSKGKGVCGTYTREVAETKSQQINIHSRDHKHPLTCIILNESDGEGRC